MANFDMAELALKSVCPNNAMKYDDKEMPSIMVFIPPTPAYTPRSG